MHYAPHPTTTLWAVACHGCALLSLCHPFACHPLSFIAPCALWVLCCCVCPLLFLLVLWGWSWVVCSLSCLGLPLPIVVELEAGVQSSCGAGDGTSIPIILGCSSTLWWTISTTLQAGACSGGGVLVLFSCPGWVPIVIGQEQVSCSRFVLQCTVLLRWGTTMTWWVYGSVWVCTLQVSPSTGLLTSLCTLLVWPHSVHSLVIVPIVTSNLEPK